MDAPLGTVRLLSVYPVKDEPGQALTRAHVEPEGLTGDRRKKRPVHVVGLPETPETTRANLFLDVPDDIVRAALGTRIGVGGVVLDLGELPSGCPGVYATVATPGSLSLGDAVHPA